MNEQKPISHLIAGLIIGAIMIIFSLVVEFAGLQQITGVPLIGYGIIMASLILFSRPIQGNGNLLLQVMRCNHLTIKNIISISTSSRKKPLPH